MPDYIDREALIEKMFPIGLVDDGKYTINAKAVKYAIDCMPKADVQEVKHGFWVRNKPNVEKLREFHKMGLGKAFKETSIFYTCSCCNGWGTPAQKYCCNCGAKIDGIKGAK